MKCQILSARELFTTGLAGRLFTSGLYRSGSDFSRKLASFFGARDAPTESDGHIAIVFDGDVIVGWARTERWRHSDESVYDTLEAFVDPDYRRSSIAAFASCGLASSALHEGGGTVAVFHPHMLRVARRAGLWPTLFAKEDGRWVRV